jgi:hypothetical protein
LGWVTITHPFHPQRGQRVEIVYLRRGPDPDLIVRLPDGLHMAVAMSSTDYVTPATVESEGWQPLLDLAGLSRLVTWLDRRRQLDSAPTEIDLTSCRSVSPAYDPEADIHSIGTDKEVSR